jgi:uncharacterized membrane protein YoaK (UPF0700 family)
LPRFELRGDASVPVSERAAHGRGGQPTDGAEAPERTKTWLAPLLAAVAGSVDAIGYLTLLRVFTAHMSGNSDAFGAELGRGSWTEVLRRGFPIPVFVLSVALGVLVIEIALRRGVRSVVAVLFSVEALLLVAFVGFGSTHFSHHAITITGGWRFYGLVALLVVAMGLQNAGLERVRGHTVRTTFVTGMLTDLAHESVASVVWRWDARAARRSGSGGAARSPSKGRVAMLAGIWTAYVAGAAAGGFWLGHVGLALLWVPIAVLLGVVVLDLRTPLHVMAAGAGSGQSRSTM